MASHKLDSDETCLSQSLTSSFLQKNRRPSSTGDISALRIDSITEDPLYDNLKGSDPISESYKSLVSLINKTSNDFKEGKKWKCNDYCTRGTPASKKPGPYPKSWKDFEKVMFAPPAKKDRARLLTTHSRTTDESQSSAMRTGSIVGKSRNQLVRQLATEDHGSKETLDGVSEITSQKRSARPQGRLPLRQWTTDGYPASSSIEVHSINPKRPSHAGSAYLLRPVSKTSVSSGNGPSGQDLSQIIPLDRPPSPAKRAAIAAAVAAAGGPISRVSKSTHQQSRAAIFSSRTHSAGEVNQGPGSSRYALHIHRLQKQQTSESAPTPRDGAQSRTGVGLPRQHSSNSAYSAGVCSSGGFSGRHHGHHQTLYSSFSHQGITLIRGASCSLVDIPTYLGPSTRGVDLGEISESLIGTTLSPTGELKPLTRPRPRPRLQLDLTQRKHIKASTRKTKWTILCVGLTLLMMSVTIVGTMLSVGSQYQQMVIAKQWETLIQNKTYSTSTAPTPTPTATPVSMNISVSSQNADPRNISMEEEEKGLHSENLTEPVLSHTHTFFA